MLYLSCLAFFDYLCTRTFSPNLSMKVSSFSKTVHIIFIKFSSHFTPKGTPAFGMASKSHDRDLRNIAKLVQKLANDNKVCKLFSNILIGFRLLHRLWLDYLPDFPIIQEHVDKSLLYSSIKFHSAINLFDRITYHRNKYHEQWKIDS